MAGMNMRKVIGLTSLLIFLCGSAFGGESFRSKGIFVGAYAGIGFPYSRGFIGNCYPAVGYGYAAGYAFSRRVSLQLTLEEFRYRIKHSEENFIEEKSSPVELLLVDLKYNLGGSRIGSYLLVGAGISVTEAYSVHVVVGRKPVIEKILDGDLVFSPGFGFQYRLRPHLAAFVECRLNLHLSPEPDLDALAYDFGEIPVKAGLTYHF
jgi:hypothetical protein